jgi:hypothetical protein
MPGREEQAVFVGEFLADMEVNIHVFSLVE